MKHGHDSADNLHSQQLSLPASFLVHNRCSVFIKIALLEPPLIFGFTSNELDLNPALSCMSSIPLVREIPSLKLSLPTCKMGKPRR